MAPRKTVKKAATSGNGTAVAAPAQPNQELIAALHELERDRGLSFAVLIEALEAALVSAYKRNFAQRSRSARQSSRDRRPRGRLVPRVRAARRRRRSRRPAHRDQRGRGRRAIQVGDELRHRGDAQRIRTHRGADREAGDRAAHPRGGARHGLRRVQRQDRRHDQRHGAALRAAQHAHRSAARPRRSCRCPSRCRTRSFRIGVARARVRHGSAQDQQRPADRRLAHAPQLVRACSSKKSPKSRKASSRSRRRARSGLPLESGGQVRGRTSTRSARASARALAHQQHQRRTARREDRRHPVGGRHRRVRRQRAAAGQSDPGPLDEREHLAEVVVPDHQLSLAIGKEGQNVRLAARLTGWRIDIHNEEQWTK